MPRRNLLKIKRNPTPRQTFHKESASKLGMVFFGYLRTATLISCSALLALTWGEHTRPESTLAQATPAQATPTQATPAPPKVEEATPIAIQKDELGKPTWDPAWDQIVENELPSELLSPQRARAVAPFCPRFKTLNEADKRAFWAYFFQALSGAEAGLLPTSDVRHPEVDVRDTVTRRMVRAEGLLQLTYMDADRYGCNFDWEKDKDLPTRIRPRPFCSRRTISPVASRSSINSSLRETSVC